MNLKHLFFAGLVATGTSLPPAQAMEWTVRDIALFDHPASLAPTDARYPRFDTAPRGIKVYIGTGEIVAGDADRLAALYHSAEGGDRVSLLNLPNPRLGGMGGSPDIRYAFPEVWLDSPGGDPFEGFRIGQVIRDLQLATVVPEGAFCASACTMAFLGGVERRIEGPYLVHAAHPVEGIEAAEVFDDVQWLSAVYVGYALRMIGDATVAEAALAFGSGGDDHQALSIDDAQLRDWGVITVAARPSQSYAPESLHSIDCAAGEPRLVTELVCSDLTLGRYDARLSEAILALEGTTQAIPFLSQQRSWQTVRDECDKKQMLGASSDSTIFGHLSEGPAKSGRYAVQACLLDVYSIRVRQLEAVIEYGRASSAASAAGWE
jgi:hypothetical protein